MSAAPHAVRLQATGAPLASRPVGMTKRPHVTIRGLCKRFDKAVIYDNFDLDIPRGELISVFGPNGCGKSTLINIIAGLIPADAGRILFDGMLLNEIKFGYVFQNYREALFPWLRARDNIEYPLKFMKLAKPEMPGQRNGFVAQAFHQATITGDHICIVIDEIVAEPRVQQALCQRHADRRGDALPQGAGGGLDARGMAILGMTRRLGSPLPECLELF